ncbi:MAG: 30S ribosomal protein S12 methylthiotransferase RimO [Bacteroidales bacterium]|nr:30S ribosomal protein S12 methylthiotransferase RimO [Bacteroidales bacterium]
MKINIITLGCSKNTVDSENLAGHLAAAGHTVHFDRTRNDCDTIIINTCGFIGDAKEESINTVLRQVEVKTRGRKARTLIVCGCLVERYREELAAEMPEVDAWFGVHQWGEIVDCLSNLNNQNTPINQISPKPTATPMDLAARRALSTPRHYAYLKIAEGCNRSCSYCAIPLIRGAHRSRPIDELVDEGRRLVQSGVKELLVISQDTTYYGMDLYRKRMLGTLLERLATETGAPWIRLHYTYPTSFPQDAIEAIRNHPNICNYIDIPLQHINSRILTSMQRGIDRQGTLDLIARFREAIPDVAIRTTLIAGYPGETEAEFEELMDFVRQARFDRMGCFPYSPEEGTEAFRLDDDVPQEEKERRVAALMALQEQISLEKNRGRIGNTYRCLVDRREGDYLIARTEYDSPEVDDEVLIRHPHGRAPMVGRFVNVKVTAALENDLTGVLVP